MTQNSTFLLALKTISALDTYHGNFIYILKLSMPLHLTGLTSFYAFHPFSLITRILEKIDKAKGILVVPYWPSQPWYPLWSRLVISEKMFFEPDKLLLYSPFKNCHPLHADLILVAATLSGRP